MNSLLYAILQIATGLLWSITYILIIRQGFKDKTYGMPMAAICANISWEFIFSFLYPHGGLQNIIIIVWFVLDVFIAYQYLKFGPKKFLYSIFFLTIALCSWIIIASVYEFSDFEGKYAAFSQNLMMSILFISLLFKRGNAKGQSIYIAVFKMIGSLIPAIVFYFYFKSELIAVLSLGTFVFDLIYVVFLHEKNRRNCIGSSVC